MFVHRGSLTNFGQRYVFPWQQALAVVAMVASSRYNTMTSDQHTARSRSIFSTGPLVCSYSKSRFGMEPTDKRLLAVPVQHNVFYWQFLFNTTCFTGSSYSTQRVLLAVPIQHNVFYWLFLSKTTCFTGNSYSTQRVLLAVHIQHNAV